MRRGSAPDEQKIRVRAHVAPDFVPDFVEDFVPAGVVAKGEEIPLELKLTMV